MRTVERAIDTCEIHSVLHRYASMAREVAPFDQMALLFQPDAIFRLPNGTAVTPANMAQVVQGESAKYIRHHITTIDIDFKVVGEEARVTAFFFAVTDQSSFDHWGRWEDIFVRGEDGRWLIAERSIVVEGADPNGWYAMTYGVPHVP